MEFRISSDGSAIPVTADDEGDGMESPDEYYSSSSGSGSESDDDGYNFTRFGELPQEQREAREGEARARPHKPVLGRESAPAEKAKRSLALRAMVARGGESASHIVHEGEGPTLPLDKRLAKEAKFGVARGYGNHPDHGVRGSEYMGRAMARRRKEASAAQREKLATLLRNVFLVCCFGFLTGAIGISFILYEGGASSIDSKLSSVFRFASMNGAYLSELVLEKPRMAAYFNGLSFNRQEIDLQNDKSALDPFAVQMVELFDITSLYMALESSGSFLGARRNESGALLLSVFDVTTDWCHIEYGVTAEQTRDVDVVVGNYSCDWDPRNTSWYLDAVEAGGLAWSGRYKNYADAWTVSAVYPVYTATGDLNIVFAADAYLEQLTDAVNTVADETFGGDSTAVLFLMDELTQLAAAVDMDVSSREDIVLATESTDRISEAAETILSSGSTESFQLWTGASVVSGGSGGESGGDSDAWISRREVGGDLGLDWVLGVSQMHSDYFAWVDDVALKATGITAFVMLLATLIHKAKIAKSWRTKVLAMQTVMCFGGVFYVWNDTTIVAVDDVISTLTASIVDRLTSEVGATLSQCELANELAWSANRQGFLPFGAAETSPDRSFDTFFLDQGNYIFPDVYSLFGGADDGELVGVFPLDTATAGSRGVFAASDATLGRIQYFNVRSDGTARLRPQYATSSYFYDPRDADWYQLGANQSDGVHAWSPVYQLRDTQQLGLTVATPFAASNTSAAGVFGASIELALLSDHLSELRAELNGSSALFIVERNFYELDPASGEELDGAIVASSTSEHQLQYDESCDAVRLWARDSQEDLIVLTDLHLRLRFDSYREMPDEWTGTVARGDPNGDVLVLLRSIRTDSGIDWIAVTSYRKSDYYAEIEEEGKPAILVGLGFTIILIYVVGVVVALDKSGKKKRKKKELREKSDDIAAISSKLSRIMKAHHWSTAEYLDGALETLKPLVARVRHMLDRQVGAEELMHAKVNELARRLVKDVVSGMEVVPLLHLESVGDAKRLQAYRLFTGRWYNRFFSVVILLYCGIAFYEAPAGDDTYSVSYTLEEITGSYMTNVLTAEALILVLLSFDMYLHIYALGIKNFKGKLRKVLVLHLVILCLEIVDWCVHASTRYTTGNADAQTLLPYSAVLRPFAVILRRADIMLAASSFVLTLMSAQEIFVLYGTILACGAVFGIVLVRGQYEELLYDSFETAFLTTFVFVSSGENYPDVVYPPTDRRTGGSFFYNIYFLVLTLLGLYGMMALLIAVFRDHYIARHEREESHKKAKKRLVFIAAFILLDEDGSGDLDIDEVLGFVNTGLKTELRGVETLGLPEFVEMSEQLEVQLCAARGSAGDVAAALAARNDDDDDEELHFGERDARGPRRLLRKFYDSEFYRHLQLLIAILHLWTLCFYGTVSDVTAVDVLAQLFMWIYAVDVLLRYLAFGWTMYWYRPSNVYIEMQNRFDMVVSWGTNALYVVAQVYCASVGADPAKALRVINVLAVFRIMSALEVIRVLFFGLLATLPQFANVFSLVLCIFYMYAVIGTTLFAGSFEYLTDDVYDMPVVNFNSMTDSFFSLFQLMIGESWAAVMNAAVVTKGPSYSLFFASWVFVIVLLFTNMLVGIVCDSYQRVLWLQETKGAGTISSRDMRNALRGIDADRYFRVVLPDDPRDAIVMSKIDQDESDED